VPERVTMVELDDVAYTYSEHAGVSGITLRFGVGNPLLLMGSIRIGKNDSRERSRRTVRPSQDASHTSGSPDNLTTRSVRAHRCWYVPQDILLFHGSVRDNLVGGQGLVVTRY